MQRAVLRPKLHVFVCGNRRAAADPLGPGCSDRGDAVYDAMKAEIARRGVHREVWVTKTHCLGICPKNGATVARYTASSQEILTEVVAGDAAGLVDP